MVRKKRTAAQDTIRDWQRLIKPTGGAWNSANKEFTWPNGARLAWGYLDQDSDVDNYAGHNYTWIAIEEANQIGSWEAVFALFATLRGTAISDFAHRAAGQDFRFLMTCNPGGPGSIWLKDTFVRPNPKGKQILWLQEPYEGRMETISACFIPAKVTDNKLLLKNNPQYLAQLLMLTRANPALRKAWIEGDWDALSGQYFDNWYSWLNNGGKIKPFRIPEHWPRYISGDWGSKHPFSFHWFAVAQETRRHRGRVIPRNALVCYREFYGISRGSAGRIMPNVGVKMTANAVGQEIARRSAMGDRYSTPDPRIVDAVLDPQCFARHDPKYAIAGSIYEGIREYAREAHVPGPRMPPFRPAQNTRTGTDVERGGWDEVRHRMDGIDYGGEQRPMVYITENCEHLLRCMPMLQHDPKNNEDVLKETGVEDHAPDEFRYGVMREAGRQWGHDLHFKEPSGFQGIVTVGQLKRDAKLQETGQKPSALGLPISFLR